jgi:tRNA-2-methylthio-N6-dimethylallyladenosine synthase
MLINSGWHKSDTPDDADLIIINSCSVREKPLLKLFSCAGRYLPLKKKKGTLIFIMGCVAQQLGKEIVEKASYIDGVFGPGSEDQIPRVANSGNFPFVSAEKKDLAREEIFPEESKGQFFEPYTAYVTIIHGCNNYCSYCIVPYVRGPEVSRKASAIVDEINKLKDNGVAEVTLLGQNVNSYKDPETGMDFSDLLYAISEKCSLTRLRFVTSHPKDFNSKLAKTFSRIPELMPYLHLPAQSGSNNMLEKMKRRYTIEQYLEKIDMARQNCPEIALSSDFIVGFPGETRDDFEQTLELITNVGYDTIYAFNYSPRPMTKASEFEDSVTSEEKFRRLNELLDRQKEIIPKVRSRYLDKLQSVLVESKSPRGDTFMGRSEHNLITHVIGSTSEDLGKILQVKITDILENTLRGSKL